MSCISYIARVFIRSLARQTLVTVLLQNDAS